MFEVFKGAMMNKFEMADMGLLHFFLEIKVNQNEDGIFIFQKKYAKELLKKIRMEDAKSITTPIEAGLTLIKYNGKKVVDSTPCRKRKWWIQLFVELLLVV